MSKLFTSTRRALLIFALVGPIVGAFGTGESLLSGPAITLPLIFLFGAPVAIAT
ncbi:hypothetical protein ACWA7J_02385 [Leptothrix sp. BB-4]